MEDFNKYLLRSVYAGMENIICEVEQYEREKQSIVDLQQRYGMSWHDALNVKEHLAKQIQK